MTLIEELKYRGFLHQCTDEESLNKKLKTLLVQVMHFVQHLFMEFMKIGALKKL